MRVRLGFLGLALAAGLGASVAGASVSAGSPAGARLRAFDGCPAFLAYVKQALPLVGPWGFGGRRDRRGTARGAVRSRAPSPRRPTSRRRTCRRRASTSPTWSSRTAPRCSSSGPDGFSRSTCAHGGRVGRLPAAAADRELRAAPSRRPAARPLARGAPTRSTARRDRSIASHTVPFEPDTEVDVSDPGAMR